MISFEKWNKAVDDADAFYKKKKVRVTTTDGTVYDDRNVCKCGGM